MKTPTILMPFFLFVFMLCIVDNFVAKQLNICVLYVKTMATRETKINLEAIKIDNGIKKAGNIKQDIQDGECFGIDINDSNEIKYILFIFEIYVKPFENEYQPNEQHGDDDSSDDRPYQNEFFQINVDDIRTMARQISLNLYEPNFSKRYTFNLGTIDPPGLFWSRRVLVETSNDLGTFHAFLYANVHTHQRNTDPESSSVFLGYAQIEQIDGGGTSTSQQQQFTEYNLLIPINATQLFKHKILNLYLEIYHFEKGINYNEKHNNESIENNDSETKECPICLETLRSEKLTMKFHEDYQHEFHKECIIKWIEAHHQVRCPICNREPKLIMTPNFHAVFGGSAESSSMFSTNPLAILFQTANGPTMDDKFKKDQAKCAIKLTEEFVGHCEAQLKQMILDAGFLDVNSFSDQKLFQIGPNGLQKHQLVQQIQAQLENMLYNRQNPVINVLKAEILLGKIYEIRDLKIYAHGDLENMQYISVNDM